MALELQSAPKTQASKTPRSFELKLPTFSRYSLGDSDRMFFTEQLALLLESGANLYKALQTLTLQTSNPAMADVIGALMDDIAQGRAFSQALQRHPKLFSLNYVNLIAASENGGFMHQVLYELKAMEEKRAELKRTLFSALSYPVFLMLFSIGVVIFVLLVVFPKFGSLFASIHDQLPVTTKVLMSMSNGMLEYGPYILIGVAAAIAGLGRWMTSAAGRETIDRLKLRLPLLGDVFAELYMVQVLRVVSLSLGNGVPMVDVLRACRDVIHNNVFRRFIDDVENLVQEGAGIGAGFERASFVPPVAKAMISTAEESGNLARVSGRVADYFEQRLTQRLKMVSRLAEPIMLLVMGAAVGLLVSSLILPIFKLSRAVT